MNLSFIADKLPGAPNFIWSEVLWLESMEIHALPTDDVIANVEAFAPKVQLVREFLGVPMLCTSWWRPPKYNAFIGGAKQSMHMQGRALDFVPNDMDCDEARRLLVPKLEEFGLRMENLPGSDWVHIDDKEPEVNRFFKP